MKDFIEELNYYIDEYHIEKQLFEKGKQYIINGYLKKDDFLAICLWKSRRPKNLYLTNTEENIKIITKKAFAIKDEKQKIEELIKLAGVGIPTASAILSVTDPQNYPIIDVRCIETLSDLKKINWKNITITNWLEYIEIIRKMAKKNNKSARDIEKGLFAYNRIKLDNTNLNLYK